MSSTKNNIVISLILLGESFALLGTTALTIRIFNSSDHRFWTGAGILLGLWMVFIMSYALIIQLRKNKKHKTGEVDHHEQIHNAISNRKLLNHLLVFVLALLEVLIIAGLVAIISNKETLHTNIYDIVAMSLILVWFGILMGYYAWTIYFYNINLGLTNHDWAEIRLKSRNHEISSAEIPNTNPNAKETLGLPTGTVRGTIALTLLVGGLAMAIAALGMKSVIKEDSFFVDNFEFFKTAFLMMIAFYFGNKSLEMIGKKKKKEHPIPVTPQVNTETDTENDTDIPASTVSASTAKKQLLKDDAEDSENENSTN